jgi:hypothetical protein
MAFGPETDVGKFPPYPAEEPGQEEPWLEEHRQEEDGQKEPRQD